MVIRLGKIPGKPYGGGGGGGGIRPALLRPRLKGRFGGVTCMHLGSNRAVHHFLDYQRPLFR